MRKGLYLFLTAIVVMIYYLHFWQPSKQSNPLPLDCYNANGETLPDILDVEQPSEGSIYFIETSCQSFVEGRIVITPRQACAVESAALNNPDYRIYLMYTSPGLIRDNITLSDQLLHALIKFENVQVTHLNYKKLLKNTVVEELYTNSKIQLSKFPINTSSNIARLLVLSKFGGVYLDLDMVIMKSLNGLVPNFAVAESDTSVNNAVLSIGVNGSGQEFIRLCLKELQDHFSGDEWGLNGPAVVTKVLKKMCGTESIPDMYNKNCSGFTVYPPEEFYPIPYQTWKWYFNSINVNSLEKSHGIHVWNKLSKAAKSNSNKSIYSVIAKKHCPQVYSIASEYF
ncbi:hypothetical protein RI129_009624 [Pyrocoelia pectoralis]|uniref:Alpha 1,4-glycosyltransferase domain-containing protein n=1 Tax=Pyrocoelia pectoralis TaxID=417401 RepID=A0AAN7ZFZ2_9COLE